MCTCTTKVHVAFAFCLWFNLQIGDLMRSFKLLVYKAEKNAMEEVNLLQCLCIVPCILMIA